MGLKQLAILACAIIVSHSAAARERFQLHLGDQQLRGTQTLPLKRLLREQHGLDASRYDLVGVRLMAKTLHGDGTAELQVGAWDSPEKRVQGHPSIWNSRRDDSFDQVDFNNGGRDDNGVWQIQLRGNFKVRKVTVIAQRRSGGGGNGGGLISYQNVRCSSTDYRVKLCEVRGRIVSIRLLEQRSDAPCIHGRTFGLEPRGVWVSGGCRGTFSVGTRVGLH